jgi:pimeloyl-ACP methyl ester carboxylesterase
MKILERGHGEPLVLVPGIQGRWEYLAGAVEQLAEFSRVITFPFSDEAGALASEDQPAGIDRLVDQIAQVLDHLQIPRAAICGVSFGGIVALRFAARHPDRTSALILVSTPGPDFRLRPRHAVYARLPWIFGPMFLLEAPFRLRREVAMAIPDRTDRIRFGFQQLTTLLRVRLSLPRMAARALMIASCERARDCAAITAPTLVVHGEASLDHVVQVEGTSEYGRLISNARTRLLERTGHLGSITRPRVFASIVREFLSAAGQERSHSAA